MREAGFEDGDESLANVSLASCYKASVALLRRRIQREAEARRLAGEVDAVQWLKVREAARAIGTVRPKTD